MPFFTKVITPEGNTERLTYRTKCQLLELHARYCREEQDAALTVNQRFVDSITFERANLAGADFEGADFEGANLSGANLEDANLWRANLKGANFAGANLMDSDLWGANLTGTIMIGARHIPDSANTTNAINTPQELAALFRGGTTRSNTLVDYFESNIAHYAKIASHLVTNPPRSVTINEEDKALFQRIAGVHKTLKSEDYHTMRRVSKGFTGRNESASVTPKPEHDGELHYGDLPPDIRCNITSFVEPVTDIVEASIVADIVKTSIEHKRQQPNISLGRHTLNLLLRQQQEEQQQQR